MFSLRFVTAYPDTEDNQRARELEDSANRRHASIVAHNKRKQTRKSRRSKPSGSKTTDKKKVEAPEKSLQVIPREVSPGDGRDPFETCAHATLPTILLEAQTYHVRSFVWTIHRLNRKAPGWDGFLLHLKRMLIQQPFLFHSYAVVSAGYMAANAQTSALQITSSQAFHDQQKLWIEGMEKELELHQGEPSDEHCLAAMIPIMIIGSVSAPEEYIHPDTPFNTIDSSYFNGAVTINLAHLMHWRALVEKKGGVPKIKNAMIRQCHESFDVYSSSKVGLRPINQRLTPYLDLVTSPPTEAFGIILDLKTRRDATAARPLSYDMFFWYRTAIEVLGLIDTTPDLLDLGPPKLDVQYGFLSFPKLEECSDPDRSDVLLGICHSAGLVFNDMVLYALPYSSGVKPRTATQLQDAISRLRPFWDVYDKESSLHKFRDFLIWACTLGAIAATKMPQMRRFFLGRLAYLSNAITDWEKFHDLLSRFLWYRSVCEEPARAVWDEMQRRTLPPPVKSALTQGGRIMTPPAIEPPAPQREKNLQQRRGIAGIGN